jgi:AraC-like DNA-binding protein
VQQVQSIILDNLPDGQVTDRLVASELHLSERSLQRRLKEHKTTFRYLLDGVREMVAKQYIENPVNRMSDIAFLIGFSEQSAFSRAFKKWTGKSPVEYRNSLN